MGRKIVENSIQEKNKKIQNANIQTFINKYNNKGNKEIISIDIVADIIIAPAMRPRTSSKFNSLYDPLSRYKKIFLEKVKAQLGELDIDNENYYVNIDIDVFINPPKNSTQMFLYNILKNDSQPVKKPDLDNVAKTVLDTFNGYFYKDDAQVTNLCQGKYYTLYNEETRIHIVLKEKENLNGRITKEQLNSLTEEEKQIIKLWKEGK